MALAEGAPQLRITVVYCAAPERVLLKELRLNPGATVADAMQASGWADAIGAAVASDLLASWKVGVWGRLAQASTPLRDLDRVEIYRPLLVDPKEARRLRFRRAPKS